MPEKFNAFKEKTENGESSARKSIAVDDYMRRDVDVRSVEEKRQELHKSSFWLPAVAKEAAPSKLKKPRKRPPSPFSGHDLRMKDLIENALTNSFFEHRF